MSRIDKLIAGMTLPEKLGQLTMTASSYAVTGPVIAGDSTQSIRDGTLGNLLNMVGAEHCHEMQKLAVEGSPEPLLELDLALQKLERRSAESAQVVLLGYFGGLTHPQIAGALGLSLATVERRWRSSRAWLQRELSPPAGRVRQRSSHGA